MDKENESLNGCNDGSEQNDHDLSEQLSQLGKQVSEFMEESEKVVENTNTSKNIDLDVTRNLEAEVQRIIQKVDKESSSVNQPVQNKEEKKDDAPDDFLAHEVAAANEESELKAENESQPEQQEGAVDNSEKQDFLENEPALDEINDSLAEQISQAVDEDAANQLHMAKKKKRKKRIIIGASIFGVLVLAAALLFGTKAGQKFIIKHFIAPSVYDGVMDYTTETPTPTAVEQQVTATPTPIINEHQDEVVNILLLGLEEIQSAQNSDVMIIASMNRKTNQLSIVSIMRDLYVDIPGHGYHKLNSAYAKGGIDLLYQTLQQNLGVHLDGYVLVNFTTFEKIVDLLGGVKVTLTQNEANYLNHTNYISNPKNRHVYSGTQIMNGNQALGYCRVRYVSTGKEANDFGRTARHRAVLNAMFDKLKDKNVFELLGFMNDVFKTVDLKTDIPKEKFSDYLTEVVDLNIQELQQHRIPEDNTFHGDMVYIGGGSHKQSVLIPNDWDETKQMLHEYLYGKDAEDVQPSETVTPTDTLTPTLTPPAQ